MKSRIAIIRALLSGPNEKLLGYLFPGDSSKVTDQNGTIDIDRVKDSIGVLSGGEQILCQVALEIWGGYGEIKLVDICRRLDDANFAAVIKAMAEFRRL